MTSAELASVLEAAERRWFKAALRRRLADGDRGTWKLRFMARAVSLYAFYARPADEWSLGRRWAREAREACPDCRSACDSWTLDEKGCGIEPGEIVT